MSELKPCPFCGGEPFETQAGDSSDMYYSVIECRKCNGSEGHPFVGVHSEEKERAAEIWNTRTPDWTPFSPDDKGNEVRLLLARLEELHSPEWWNQVPSTDLQQQAQRVAKLFPPTIQGEEVMNQKEATSPSMEKK